eukprot:2891790-Amphidinium_carterae.1
MCIRDSENTSYFKVSKLNSIKGTLSKLAQKWFQSLTSNTMQPDNGPNCAMQSMGIDIASLTLPFTPELSFLRCSIRLKL